MKQLNWVFSTLGSALVLVGVCGRTAAQEQRFLVNGGQWPAEVSLRTERGAGRAWFIAGGWVLDLDRRRGQDAGRACALRFELVEASEVRPRGVQQLAGLHHFLRGADPGGWQTGVASYSQVLYEEAWPGIDIIVHEVCGSQHGAGALFEYDLQLAPGARLQDAVIAVEGALGLSLDHGALLVHTSLGDLRQTPPLAWSLDAGGARQPVACEFVLLDEQHFGFAAPERDPNLGLLVDPGVEWSSYIGAFDEDIAQDVSFAIDGDVVIAGTTLSYEYPVTMGAYDTSLNGQRDAFVTRFEADGATLVYSTVLGGSLDDWGASLALSGAGEVWIAGDTQSSDFPTSALAHDPTHNGATDVFVAKLSSNGANLTSSTLLGGAGEDHASELVLSLGQEPRLAGWTDSSDFPVTPAAFDTSPNGGRDAFVVGWSLELSALRFSSLLGGVGQDMGLALVPGATANLYLAGLTSSFDFPATGGAYDSTHNSGVSPEDGFVACFSDDGSTLCFATFFGGGGRDVVEALALDAAGDLWFAGFTESLDLPLAGGALQASYLGLEDGFVAKLGASGASLDYSSYLGGSDRDRVHDLKVDVSGLVAICGETRSSDFPSTVWSFDPSFNSPTGGGVSDAFVLRLDSAGGLDYGGFLGGGDEDLALAMALHGSLGAVVVGSTNSYNFPTTYGSFDRDYDLSYISDGFVVRFDFARFPYNFGSAKTNSLGWWAALSFAGFPSLSGPGFSIYLDGALPFGVAFLFHSDQPGGGPFMGGSLLMGPPYVRTAALAVDWFGSTEAVIQIDPSMVGSTYVYQAWYADPADAWGVGLSDGLRVTYYP